MNEYDFTIKLSGINNQVQYYKNKESLSAKDIFAIDNLSVELQKLYNICKLENWFTEQLSNGIASYGVNILEINNTIKCILIKIRKETI